MMVTMADAQKHLWEIYHPYYGAEAFDGGNDGECETLDELIHMVHSYDQDMNHVYRWDWMRYDPRDYGEDEEVPGDELVLFVVLQRKSRFVNCKCPVTETDEDKVREFLASDRILGALKLMWEPLL
jgi:hypothetical protein